MNLSSKTNKLDKQAIENGRKVCFLVARRCPVKDVNWQGKTMRLYSISWLAQIAGKSPKTIHDWEKKRVFPSPIMDLGDTYRWYTAAEVKGYAKIIRAAGLRRGRYPGANKQTDWLKTTTMTFKGEVIKYLQEKLGDFPMRLAEEDAVLEQLRKATKVRFTPEDLERMIR